MATKKEAGAPALQEAKKGIWTIGELEFRIPDKNTTAIAVKTIVKSVILRNKYDIKNTYITLPSGRKVLYKQLSNIREFTKLLFPDIYLLPESNSKKERLWEVLVSTAMKAGKKEVSWEDIGNDRIGYGVTLLSDTLEELLSENAISEEEREEFLDMINTYKNHYIA